MVEVEQGQRGSGRERQNSSEGNSSSGRGESTTAYNEFMARAIVNTLSFADSSMYKFSHTDLNPFSRGMSYLSFQTNKDKGINVSI